MLDLINVCLIVVALFDTQPTSKVWTAVKMTIRRKYGRARRYKSSAPCYNGGAMFMVLSMHYKVTQLNQNFKLRIYLLDFQPKTTLFTFHFHPNHLHISDNTMKWL